MSDIQTKQSLILEAKLDLMAAPPLNEALSALQGEAVNLDASNVTHIDMPCLQILLAAAKHWQRSDMNLYISNPSDAFRAGLETLGIDPLIFQKAETF
ncbi:MAG: STAS domain-containing protein [Maricaulaceae bacterium]